MVLKRILTALVLLPLVLGVIVYGEVAGTAVLIAAAAAIAVGEFLRLTPELFKKGETLALQIYGALIVLSFLCPEATARSAMLAGGTLIYMIFEASKGEPDRATLSRIAMALSASLYVAFFLGHAVTLRGKGPDALIFVMILVMVGDSAAFFVGTLFGRHRLAPKISPKKSIEGSIGGFVAVAACGAIFSGILKVPHTPFEGALIAMVINVVSQAGDLAESLLKRASGVKDTGALLPGHGGMLDRVDSFLLTLPLYAGILSLYGG